MILTSAQLTSLRLQPHLTKLYLSVYQPTTVLACQVNNVSAAKGDRSITFDGVTAGSYLLVQSGMTLYVGTSAGAFDKGTVRVKSASSTVLTIAENSHIDWADNDYLTVINFYEINAVYPRIIQNPADETQTLWYKDYDIEYTNQNSVLGTIINMGPHHAGFLENGTCNVYYTSSGTYNLLDDTLSYSWFFEGATTTGSTAHTPGNISYSTPGHYTTRLTVSGSSGGVDTSYRHISIYDRPDQGDNPPIVKWELADMAGSRDQGGYTARVIIHETIAPSLVKDGSLIVIFADDWYGDKLNKQSIGGNALNRSSIVFVGYVLKGSIKYNYRDSTVEFEIGSPSEIMKLSEGFAVSIMYSNDPSTATSDPNVPSGWVVVKEMNVRRAIYHYLRWHSTVFLTTDVQFIGLDRYLQYFDADRTSIFDAVRSAMKSIWVGGLACDRQGKLWGERDIYISTATWGTTFTLSNQDWIGDISIEEQRTPQTSFIEMGGIYFTGPTGEYTPLLSQAPGVAPGYRGKVERIQGLALTGQSELNTLIGRVFAQRNVIYPNIDISLAGNYRNYDIAPQENIPLTVTAADTKRGIAFTNKNFFINRISYRYDPLHESFTPQISLTETGTGFAGDTITIPAVPEGGGYEELDIPAITVPPYPVVDLGRAVAALPTYCPILSANVDGVGDVAPTYGDLGGVTLGNNGSAQIMVGFPSRTGGSCNVMLLYYEGGTGTIDVDPTIKIFNSSAAAVETVGVGQTLIAVGSSHFSTTNPQTITWSGVNGWVLSCNYVFTNRTGTIVLQLMGVIITWTR